MKTFKELLVELKHIYGRYEPGGWGTIDKKNKMIDGDSHPTATVHRGLRGGVHDDYYVDYFREKPSRSNPKPNLNIRTYNMSSLNRAIKHFDRLPHRPGDIVTHTHTQGYETAEHVGTRNQVLRQMIAYRDKQEKYFAKLQAERKEREAQKRVKK